MLDHNWTVTLNAFSDGIVVALGMSLYWAWAFSIAGGTSGAGTAFRASMNFFHKGTRG
jgi:hypothetical protein